MSAKFKIIYLKSFIMRYLSSTAFVIVLLLVLLPSCQQMSGMFNKKKKQAEYAAVLKAKQDSIRVADSLKQAQAALLALEQARQDSIRFAEEARTASKYHMIVGSFYTPEYARNWAEIFRQRNYNVQVLKMRGSTFELVSAEAFSSLRSAYNRLQYYQENVMPDAWIYIDE